MTRFPTIPSSSNSRFLSSTFVLSKISLSLFRLSSVFLFSFSISCFWFSLSVIVMVLWIRRMSWLFLLCLSRWDPCLRGVPRRLRGFLLLCCRRFLFRLFCTRLCCQSCGLLNHQKHYK